MDPESDKINTAIARLCPDATVDQVAEALGLLDSYLRRGKELKAGLDAALFEYVTANGSVTIGDVRYYAGRRTVTKCKNDAGTMGALMDAASGDLAQFCEQFLAATWVKHGAAKSALTPERFAECFDVTEVEELRDGAPSKKLLSVNTRFTGR